MAPIHRSWLDNGIQILVEPTGGEVAAVVLWLDAGTVDETSGEEGAAHFMEHMLFKGTPSREVGVAAAEIEALGGDLNAWTSLEQTVLDATVEAGGWDHALEVVVDMARDSLLDPEEVERERQVVLEEILGREDEPAVLLELANRARLYPDHPYGRSILGNRSSIEAMDVDALERYRERCYAPSRITVAISGVADADRVVRRVEQLVGGWTAPHSRRELPPPRKVPPRVGILDGDFDSVLAELTWPTPPLDHPDIAALDIIADALGQGSSSRLSSRLHHQEGLAFDVWATLSQRPLAGQLSVGFTAHPGSSLEALQASLDEIGEVCRRGLAGLEVTRARDGILTDMLFNAETAAGRAADMAWYAVKMGSPEARERYRDAVAATRSEQVRRVARRWLAPDRCTVMVLDRELERDDLKVALRPHRRRPRWAKPSGEARRVFEGGARLVVLPDDAPVAAAQAVVVGGGLAETSRHAGLGKAWARMITAGAGEFDVSDFAEATDDACVVLEGSGNRSTLGLRATFPAANADDALDLFAGALAAPWFDAEEWDRIREELQDDLRTRKDRPAEIALDQLWAMLWRGHPWRLAPAGTRGSLDRIESRTLSRLHNRLFTGDNLVVVVAGGVEVDAVYEQLEPWLCQLPPGGHGLVPRPDPLPPDLTDHSVRAGREQAQVVCGARCPGYRDPDRVPLELAATILGSQSGRLFLDLREERGLAYSVWADAMAGWDGGVLCTGLATAPDQVDEAADSLEEALQDLADTPPTPEEVQRSRRMLYGLAAMEQERATGRAGAAAYGIRFDVPWSLADVRAELDAVEPEDIRDAVERALSTGLVRVTVAP